MVTRKRSFIIPCYPLFIPIYSWISSENRGSTSSPPPGKQISPNQPVVADKSKKQEFSDPLTWVPWVVDNETRRFHDSTWLFFHNFWHIQLEHEHQHLCAKQLQKVGKNDWNSAKWQVLQKAVEIACRTQIPQAQIVVLFWQKTLDLFRAYPPKKNTQQRFEVNLVIQVLTQPKDH